MRPVAAALLVASLLPSAGCAATAPRPGVPPRAPLEESPREESAAGPGLRPSNAVDGRARDAAARALLRTAPLALPRASFFHAALDLPRMETARPLPSGAGTLALRTSHAGSERFERDAGVKNEFDGIFHEWLSAEARLGVGGDLELGLRTAVAGWDERRDEFEFADAAGRPLVRGEGREVPGRGATNRHFNLSGIGASAKARLVDAPFDGAVRASFRYPVGRNEDLTHAGTADASLALLATVPAGRWTLHANLGGTLPVGESTLFVRGARVDLHPVLVHGVGATLPLGDATTLALQVEGNTSAFPDVRFLDAAPLTAAAGLRRRVGAGFLEIALGGGFDREASFGILGSAAWVVVF